MEQKPAYYAVIPASVRYCKELEPMARLLYAEITCLTHTEGYCYASNQHFADLYDVDVRTIQRWLEGLKKHGFITVETQKSGIHFTRTIRISGDIQKQVTKGQKCHGGTPKMSCPPDKNVAIILNTNKSSDEDITRGASPPAVLLFSFFIEMLKKHVPEVMTMPDAKTAKVFDKLLELRSSDEIKAVIIFSLQDEFWRQHVHSPNYLKVKYDRLLAKMNSTKSGKHSDIEPANDFIARLKAKYDGHPQVDVGPSYVEIRAPNGMVYPGYTIKYGEKGFEEQVKNALRKMRLPIDGI